MHEWWNADWKDPELSKRLEGIRQLLEPAVASGSPTGAGGQGGVLGAGTAGVASGAGREGVAGEAAGAGWQRRFLGAAGAAGDAGVGRQQGASWRAEGEAGVDGQQELEVDEGELQRVAPRAMLLIEDLFSVMDRRAHELKGQHRQGQGQELPPGGFEA